MQDIGGLHKQRIKIGTPRGGCSGGRSFPSSFRTVCKNYAPRRGGFRPNSDVRPHGA
jgi:hypothetical protein